MDGHPPPQAFWAKLRQHDGVIEAWHPLADHCADVAACCEALLSQPTMRRRLARLAGVPDLSPLHRARLSVLAALHDSGKFNLGFQARALARGPFVVGHVGPIIKLFDRAAWGVETERLVGALNLNELATWCEDEASFLHLFLATLAHHGRPIRPEALPPAQPRWWQASDGLDPFTGMADLMARLRRWFPEAFLGQGDPLPHAPAFQHAFSGLVTLADWLGSDTSFFRYSTNAGEDRMPYAREAARAALDKIGLDPTGARGTDRRAVTTFERVCAFAPNDMQRALTALPVPQALSLTILESETGSGKTEAALARFLALFEAGVVDGLYFALPTRTAATQMQRRVVDAVERAFPVGRRPPVVLAVPGYLVVVDRVTGRRLPGFEVLWAEDDRERVRHRSWAAENPKRYLAGAIVVGTIDQVLLSTLVVRHAHLRAAALLRHLLVVDEVHASDAYMTRLLEAVLERHLAAGGHALLMSATLGAAARTRLLSPGSRSRPPAIAEAVREPYPGVTYREGPLTPRTLSIEATRATKRIRADLVPSAGEPEAVARRALEAARRGARVLVVRNTVRDCIATQEAMEKLAGPVDDALLFGCQRVRAPHHARFATADRVALDVAIENEFGKDRRAGGRVAMATQTVQQSLDLDADLLVTDLCPMDVLLQRLGRLHRHARGHRPSGFEAPSVQVLIQADRDLGRLLRRGEARGPQGLGTVYGDLLVLESTWRILETTPVLTIPDMNRDLVERATHPEALKVIADELGGPWAEHWTRMSGVRFAAFGLAALNLIPWRTPFGDTAFPDGDLGHEVRTRLGEGDRIAQFASPFQSPFGQSVSALAIPAHLAGDAPADAELVVESDRAGSLTFRFGSHRFVYDRLGLRPATATPSSEEDLADA